MLSLGATYGTFRRELEREAITLIPFTCVDTFRGHLEKVRITTSLNLPCYVDPISRIRDNDNNKSIVTIDTDTGPLTLP